jgi:hypothetical protein
MTTRTVRKARRIAQAVRLTRRGIPMYGVIPLRLLADPVWRETHLLAPRTRETVREWDRLGVTQKDRGIA